MCDWLRWGKEGDGGGQMPWLKGTEEGGKAWQCTKYWHDVRTSAALVDGALVVVEVREHAHSVEVVASVFNDSLRTVLHQMLKQRQRLPDHVKTP